MRWVGHIARIGGAISAYRCWSVNLKGRDNLEDLGVDDGIKMDLRDWIGLIWLRKETGSGLL
jgi:hypothetical protein